MSERGRFAPSPTGELHLGNARTALLAWLWARSTNGGFTMRIEDLDRPRCRPGLAEKQLEELRWLGLDWDEGAIASADADKSARAELGARGPYRQSERAHLYDAAIEQLRADGHVYECFCSRAQIRAAHDATARDAAAGGMQTARDAAARGMLTTIDSPSDDARQASSEASAPHGPHDDGPRYPGTCENLSRAEIAERRSSRPPALRLRVPPGAISFHDAIAGEQQFDPAAEVGDFVLRRADGIHAYQLAVVVDDAAMGITQVLRGRDLLASTARQILLYRLLGFREPAWAHAPLLFGPPSSDGTPQRLSKRAGEGGLASLIERGIQPERIVAALARSSGLIESSTATCAPRELLARFSLEKISTASLPISLV